MKTNLKRSLIGVVLVAVTVATMSAAAGAAIVSNTAWQRPHQVKTDCTMVVALDSVHTITASGQRVANVRPLANINCAYSHKIVPQVRMKVDGVFDGRVTQTTAPWYNSRGMGSRYLWGIGILRPGCHTYQGFGEFWVDGHYSYVTTNTPKTICA